MADPMSPPPSPPSRRSLAPSRPRGPLCEGDPGGGGRATIPAGRWPGSRLSRARIPAVAGWLLCALALRGAEARPPPVTPGLLTADGCLNRFTPGVPDFVLDTDASVRNGATFLRSLTARRDGTACTPAAAQRLQSGAGGIAIARRREDAIVSLLPHQLPLRAELRVQVRAQGGFHQLPRGRFTAPTASCGPRALEVGGGCQDLGRLTKGLVIGSLREASRKEFGGESHSI